MKQTIVWYLALVVALSTPAAVRAQLMRRVRQTATSAMSQPARPAAQTSNQPANNKPVAPQAIPDLSQYGVKVTVVTGPLPMDRSFLGRYSCIEVRGGEIVASTAVEQFPPQKIISEMREDAPGNEVVFYENGKETGRTTVGELSKYASDRKRDNLAADNWPYGQVVEQNASSEKTEYIRTGVGAYHLDREIVIGGKSYGPYMMIDALVVNTAGTRFYAIVTENKAKGPETFFISDKKKIKLPGTGAHILVNPDMSNACAVQVMPMELVTGKNTDALQLQKLGSEGPAYFIDGTVRAHTVYVNGWLDLSGKNIFGANNGVYLNGKQISTIAEAQDGNAWCSADASHWAVYNPNDHLLVLSEGATIRDVIHPAQVLVNGKSYFTWMVAQQGSGGQVLLCSKEL